MTPLNWWRILPLDTTEVFKNWEYPKNDVNYIGGCGDSGIYLLGIDNH